MRYPLLLLLLVAFSGCDLLGPKAVDAAVITQVTVEDLDLTQPWDSPITSDRPDIYVNAVRLDDSVLGGLSPIWRTRVVDNVETLPLIPEISIGEDVLWEIDRPLQIDVADEDVAGDDLMFTTGAFTFADRYDDEEIGETSQLTFESEEGRIMVFVRWE